MPKLTERFTAAWKAATGAFTGRLPFGVGVGGSAANGAFWVWVDPATGNATEIAGQPGTSKRKAVDFDAMNFDATLNSAVAACLASILTMWAQAVPVVMESAGKRSQRVADMKPVEDHPLTYLMVQPSPWYNGRLLQMALLADWYGVGRGNAYAYIAFNSSGQPAELQHLPAIAVQPRGSNTELITHYDYSPGGGRDVVPIPRERVLHFRNGIDPDNPRKGRDPLVAVRPEIATDNEATAFQYKLLSKRGTPPWVLAPKMVEDGVQVTVTEDQARTLKDRVAELIRDGDGIALPVGFQLDQFGFNPKDMVIGETQRKSEERVAAAFNLPPVVAGLGAGLDRSTFANYEEARRAAWQDCVIPLQDAFAAEVSAKLFPLFGEKDGRRVLTYDRSEIGCLQENRTEDATRLKTLADAAQVLIAAGFTAESVQESLNLPDGLIPKPQAEPVPTVPTAKQFTRIYHSKLKSPKFFEAKKAGDPPLSDIEATAARFRDSLRAHEAGALDTLNGALEIAERRILADLDALIGNMEAAAASGETIGEGWLQRQARFKALLSQIQIEYVRLAGGDAYDALRDAQAAYVAIGAEGARTLTLAAIGEVPTGVAASLTWNTLPVATIESLVGFASDGSPLRDLLAAIAPDTVKGMEAALIEGVALGWNPKKTARALQEAAGGKLALARARAETIARTETMRAAREAARRSYVANSDVVTGWTWCATLDARTCAGCWAMHGTVHALTQTLDDHPNGRCVATPRTKSWGELLGDDSLPDTRPVIEAGAARFERLPKETQGVILGGLYESFAAGELVLTDCVTQERSERWGTMRRAATGDEARANAARRAGQ